MRCADLLLPCPILLVGLSLGLLACSSTPENPTAKAAPAGAGSELTRPGGPFRQQWAMDALWEDGRAEVATYQAERVIYDEPRQFEYTLITVKEEFNQQHNVKTDDYQRKDLFPVMKVNQFCRIPTDNYPYHFLTSLFFRRDQPVQLHKLTTSSQEWCGTTFKAFTDEGLHYLETYNSYWDGQGAGQRQVRRDVLFEDALPYTLRSLQFDNKPRFAATIVELQQTSKAPAPTLYQARLRVEEAPAEEVPQAAWRVTVDLAPQKRNVYWFARRYPNVLLRQTTWDGRTLFLKSVRRYAYWNQPAAPSSAIAADSTGK
ncbi:hypothetical protein [Hymenobacter weizhouensis]|uniref:hypothetical protein n=1 Tax=Hymenobacter sp. YIM 151500-1 TaxID=2987689 RepID=UPI002227C663|nr:hypothetical protein [Hymenobacter sp. YIM 151500-1]UYZ64390.1 hypothetical protein OIS53_05945 [Hymenobacter sp. YIM 151500-1]